MCLYFQLYRTLNVRVVVVHVITWTAGDMITYPSDNDPNELLNNLEDYEPQVTPVHDSTMLITYVCVCMYVCMYVCVYMCENNLLCVYVYICVCTYVCVHNVYICVCT